MEADIFIIHLLLAVVLFFVANWLGRHSITSGYHLISLLETVDEAPVFNFVFRVSTPLVYLAITAALLYALGLDRYVHRFYEVVIYYFAIRWLYSLTVGRVRLLNWPLQLGTAAFTAGCAYILDREVLSARGSLLPDPQSFNSNLWVLIVLYVYATLNRIPFRQAGAARRRDNFLMNRYYTLRAAFGAEVSAVVNDSAEEALVYAVLIYETFNRPYVYRAIERWILFPVGLSKTLGPMQIETQTPISESASVRAGAVKLIDAFRISVPTADATTSKWSNVDEKVRRSYVQSEAIRLAAQQYNIRSDYASEIESVYRVLVREVYQTAGSA